MVNPFRILRIIYQTSPRDIIRSLGRRINFRINSSEQPHWTIVENGPLKGHSILLASELFSGWDDMIQGEYDAYFFKNKKILSYLKTAIIWDVGAHFGYTALSFSTITGEDSRIIAFEPNPFNFERFKENLEKNPDLGKKVTLLPFALSEEDGEDEFLYSSEVDKSVSSGSHLKSFIPPLSQEIYADFKVTKVKTRTIDSLIDNGELPSPTVIKIDVEGAEYAVLCGAINCLNKYRPLLLIEIHNVTAMLYVSSILRDQAYKIELLEEDPNERSRCFIIGEPIFD